MNAYRITSILNGITSTKDFPFTEENDIEVYSDACNYLAKTSINIMEDLLRDSLTELNLPLGDMLYHLRDLRASVTYWDHEEHFELSSFEEAYCEIYEENKDVCNYMMANNNFEIRLTTI